MAETGPVVSVEPRASAIGSWSGRARRRPNVDASAGFSSLSSNGDERDSTADVAIIVRDQTTITIRRGLSVVRRGLSGIKRGRAGVKRGWVFVLGLEHSLASGVRVNKQGLFVRDHTRRGGAGYNLKSFNLEFTAVVGINGKQGSFDFVGCTRHRQYASAAGQVVESATETETSGSK